MFEAINRPRIEKKPWMNDVHMELVTPDTLDRVVDECVAAGVYGFDIETEGLDNRAFKSEDGTPYTVHKIVGYCLASSETRGFYIPVRHAKDGEFSEANVPLRLVVPALQRLVNSPAKAVFHNGKFDQEFLQHEVYGGLGEWDNPDAWEDTLLLAYMRNTRERNKGLKFLSKRELDREMIELDELFNKDEIKAHGKNFARLDPLWEPVVWYATSDAVCTLALYKVLAPQVVDKDTQGNDQKALYKIEKACITATRWMERCRVPVDRDRVATLIRLGQKEWFDCLIAVYDEVNKQLDRDTRPKWLKAMMGDGGYDFALRFDPESVAPSYMESREIALAEVGDDPDMTTEPKSVPSIADPRRMESVSFPLIYDVTIAEQLGSLLRELGVKGLKVTEKSGQIKTSKDELARVIEEAGDEFPFMIRIRRFREVAKALSSNLFPIWNDTTPERSPDSRMKVGFHGHKVDTGRFATPAPEEGGGEFNGQVRWNLHSIPAGHDKKKPECMRRMREIIRVPKGKVLFAIDYSGVELRIVTNLSGEPKWINEFFRCSDCDTQFERGNVDNPPPAFCPKCGSDKIGDLHTLTALAIYGENAREAPDFKLKRQNSKGLNFAMCYGGGGSAAQRSVGVDKDEGWRIKNQFDKAYTGLRRWWGKQHDTGRRWGYVTTAFGRKYPVPDITHTDGGFRSKAERNAVNGPVQGSSADIMKLAMVLIHREVKKRGWLEKVKMLITIHDELVFEVDGDVAEEAVDLIVPLMIAKTVAPLKWLVPLKVDIEFGEDWTVPNNLTEMEHGKKPWKPEWEWMFPRRTGKSVPVETTEAEPSSAPEPVKAFAPPPLLPVTPVGADGVWVHIIPSARLTFGMVEKLARVITKCEGRGTATLRITTDTGEVLYDGGAKVAPAEFRSIAMFEGV